MIVSGRFAFPAGFRGAGHAAKGLLPAFLALPFLIGCGDGGAAAPADFDTEAEAEAAHEKEMAFDPVAYINPMIATGGYGPWGVGSALPGAAVPSGLVKVSPDTRDQFGLAFTTHCAGYYYPDPYITGFSQVHFYGTGVPDYGVLSLLPKLGADVRMEKPDDPFWTTYKKETEAAAAAYYTVTLADGVKAELTATTRAAFHRYTFPEESDQPRCIVIDAGHYIPLCTALDTHLTIDPEKGEFGGFVHNAGGLTLPFNGYNVYFKGALSAKPDRVAAWEKTRTPVEGKLECQGPRVCGAVVCFSGVNQVEARIGISYVSEENAAANLQAEAAGKTFEAARRETEGKWRERLAAIQIDTADEEQRTIFYTALYHVFMMPTIQSDVNGDYLGFDRQPHSADWGLYYSDFSLWDTYRTQHPLFTLVYPRVQREMVYSLLAQARTGGYFPKWSAANGETNCMVGTPADVVVADSFLKGIEFPHEESFDYLMKTALAKTAPKSGFTGREKIEDYLALGYVPADETGGSVAKTQEYAFADNALCAMAAALDRPEKSILCKNRYNYTNLWNAKTSFFLGRNKDGSFPGEAAFDPEKISPDVFSGTNRDYVEGTAWQYRWFAPHDAEGLIALDGGPEPFVEKLVYLFERSMAEEHAIAGDPVKWGGSRRYFWQANEPGLHTPYFFSAAGRIDLTCRYVRWGMRTYYKNSPIGLPGNDDAGTMSAWYIFSALGFYPIPGMDIYYLGCPLYPSAKVRLDGGVLTVTAEGPLDDEAKPVRITFNGQDVPVWRITWQEIRNGGELKFYMEH